MSLRARLIATLLALAAVGMLILAAVTYATQRSFLEDRVDEQTRAAAPLLGGGGRGPRFRPYDRGPGGLDPDPDRDGDRPRPEATLPPGTYAETRDAAGRTVGAPRVVTFGQGSIAPPALPVTLRAGETLAVRATSGEVRYRVRASRNPNGGLTVVAIPLTAVNETLDRLLAVEAVVISAVLLVLGGLAWLLVRAGLRPLERIGATADAIAGGDLSRRVDVAGPRTEVGRLGQALNAMLARLERAFAEREASERRLRVFLADASHELRTPLASIRGYAELFRIGAARAPADTEKAMRRIEDEAARMGVLVEELLTLARLDEAPDTVAEPVDLADLAQDAVADARVVAPDRVVEAHLGDDAVVLGDPNQLRQVLGNLVRNALVHTPAGTRIEVTARRDGPRALLEVRDHGGGLPTDEGDVLFERFWRAEAGRERGRAGAGLGLAIVAGIVASHRGEVSAADAPGGGAAFRVWLPLAPAQAVSSEREPEPERVSDAGGRS